MLVLVLVMAARTVLLSLRWTTTERLARDPRGGGEGTRTAGRRAAKKGVGEALREEADCCCCSR